MAKSVTEPITQAYNRTVDILFKPFNITKWFVLGFAAWLAQLGEGGGGGNNFNFPMPGGRGGGFPVPPAPPAPPAPPMPPLPGGIPPAPAPAPPTFPSPPTPQEEFAAFLAQMKQFFFN